MGKHLLDFPTAADEARPYLEALERNRVPYSIEPEYDEDEQTAVGIQIGVDAVGKDGWARWVVIPFREDLYHPPGFIRCSERLEEFERASLEWDALAIGLAACRRSSKQAYVEKTHEFSILRFRSRF